MRYVIITCCLLFLSAHARAFPERPLKVVMPYPATGSPDIEGTSRITKLLKTMQSYSTPPLTDIVALQLVQSLSGALEWPVNLERHPTGNTIAGTSYVIAAVPDGHTLLFAGNPTITIFPSTFSPLPFNPQKDLAPVALFVRVPYALIATHDNPANSVRDVIERARRTPGKINYAALGEGSTAHLTGELFRAMSGAEMVHINYNGGIPAINAVVTRNVDFAFVPLGSVLPFLNGGAVRILALASAVRHASVPTVPTVAESGVAGFDAEGWFGVFAGAETPGAIDSRLNAAVNRALSEDHLKRMLTGLGLSVAPDTPGSFRTLIQKDTERWARILKAGSAYH